MDFLYNFFAVFAVIKRKLVYSNFFSKIRVATARLLGANIGEGVRIRPGVLLKGHKNISINDNCFIGENTTIVAYGAKVTIGKKVLIADNVYISSRNHRFSNSNLDIIDQGYKCLDVCIQDNVWLGHGSVVLSGSIVPKRTILGANSIYANKIEEEPSIHTVVIQKTKIRKSEKC